MLRNSVMLVVAALLLAIPATVHAKIYRLTFVIDEQESTVRVDGEVLGIDVEGDQTTAVGGTIDIRALVNGSKPKAFIIDRSDVNQLDAIDLEVPNPIPGFPPLAEFSVLDLALGITTGPTLFGPNLTFSTNTGRAEVLSGVAEGQFLGDPIGPIDFTGNVEENVLIEGGFSLVENQVRIEFPIRQEVVIPDVPGTFVITGSIVAYAPLN